jgi:predicted MFS family arabinose efflux permease
VADGVLLLAGFLWLERRTAQRGGAPLIDLALLTDTAFQRGLCAVFALFTGNIAFYLVITLFLQQGLRLTPLSAGLTVLPPALAFVLASRLGTAAVVRDGVNALMRGCVVQLVGLGSTASVILLMPAPVLLIAPLALFCFGQGLVLAPLYGVVLAQVRPTQAGAGAGVLTTVQQIGNGTGVAAIGALYVAVQLAGSDRVAVLTALAALSLTVIATLLLLRRMGRAA